MNPKVEKIVVETEHELTDIVRSIHKSSADRIVLTFTEQSDLLISPINLKVIQDTANREGKLLITQIIQNPTGVRNSKLANMKVIETPTKPTEQDWDDAVVGKSSKKAEEEKPTQEPEQKPSANSFEKRVNDAVSRSQVERALPKKSEDEDVLLIDSDVPEIIDNTKRPEESLAGKDFKSARPSNSEVVGNNSNPKFVPPTVNLKKLPKINIDKKYLRLLPKLLIPFLAILILGAFAYYKLVPFTKVRIFVEAKPVSIEKSFTGDLNIDTVDFDNLKIPIKTEEVTKSLSDSVTATGTAYKGEKAKGSIRITYTKQNDCSDDTPKILLNTGQTVSTSEYSYKLLGSAELTCNSMTDVQVEASEIGEEYNIPASKFFTLPGYSNSEVYGLNSSEFSGGSKEEYTVLSQQDVNTVVDSLSETAIEEVKGELRLKNEGWDLIENTIKSEVDKSSIKTDVTVGQEATTANLQLSIKGTATYYLTKGLDEGLSDLLRTEAQEQNLFENNNDWDLVLGEDIEKELTVEESSGDSVIIKLTAKANVKPDVDKVVIEERLKGMKWNEGLAYLADLNFAAQPTEVEFKPDRFPDFLKYFPNKQGGVMISVLELQSE